jgi:hypothetical protein
MKGSRGSKLPFKRVAAVLAMAASCVGGSAHAGWFDYNDGKVFLTEGVSMADGAAGGGAVPWAVIAGNETRDGINGNVHFTYVSLPNYSALIPGAAIGFFDRFELSAAYAILPTGSTFDTVGLVNSVISGSSTSSTIGGVEPWNTTIKMQIYGAKVRVFGEAIYDSDNWIPQVAVGGFYKINQNKALLETLGANKSKDFEAYVAATKIFFPISTAIDITARYTAANEIGLTGFGGPNGDSRKVRFEGSLAYLLAKNIAIGGEYQQHGNNLGGHSVNLGTSSLTSVTNTLAALGLNGASTALTQQHESSWADIFAAYAPAKNLSFTMAMLDFGNITFTPNQIGFYLSVAASF